jgi:hypothetical protein
VQLFSGFRGSGKSTELRRLRARLPDLARFLDTHLMLCYRNGSEWYDVHPTLRDEISRQVTAVRGRATRVSHE